MTGKKQWKISILMAESSFQQQDLPEQEEEL
jgi:hypothetical protein